MVVAGVKRSTTRMTPRRMRTSRPRAARLEYRIRPRRPNARRRTRPAPRGGLEVGRGTPASDQILERQRISSPTGPGRASAGRSSTTGARRRASQLRTLSSRLHHAGVCKVSLEILPARQVGGQPAEDQEPVPLGQHRLELLEHVRGGDVHRLHAPHIEDEVAAVLQFGLEFRSTDDPWCRRTGFPAIRRRSFARCA